MMQVMKMDKKKSFRNVNNCLLCKSTNLTNIFEANEIALTGLFPKIDEKDPVKTPINLNVCNDCSNLQIAEIVEKGLMFNDYWYRSGTTKSMVNHFENILNTIKNKKDSGTLLDIGCNDCTFLEIANKNGYDGYGVEPSVAYNDRKILDNKKIANDFFPPEKNWSLDVNKFDIITAISMFYDVEDPYKFLSECKKRLNENGLLLIEVNYAKLFLERKNVDMLGQEHLIFYFIKTFQETIKKAGFYLNDAELNEMNGGNIVFMCGDEDYQSDRLLKLIHEEEKFIQNFDFLNFQKNVDYDFNKLKNKIEKINKNKKNLKIYGASTRGAFICQYLKLSNEHFDCAVDIQLNKDGRRIPGTNIKIEMEKDTKVPDTYLILPYQFLDEFIKKNLLFLKNGGTFLCFRPSNIEIFMNEEGEIIKTNY